MNTEQLRQFVVASYSMQDNIPGAAYFKKINKFMIEHVQVGKLYLKYLRGDCQKTNILCEFCAKLLLLCSRLGRVPRPMPDHETLPELCYLPHDKTPTITLSGSNREVDNYQPRAQAKKRLQHGTLKLEDAEAIKSFSKTFAVEENLTRKYLEHLEYIHWKKEKSSEERRRKNKRKSEKIYDDYDWVQMFREGTISKVTVPVLDLFLYKLNLASGKQKKAGKVNKSNAWLANSEYHKIQQSGIQGFNGTRTRGLCEYRCDALPTELSRHTF